jgi:predicted MPP superfamily phosphohydrolase
MTWVIVTLAVVAAAGLGWALFEAQWVELLERDAPVRGLPAELDGLRVLHVSDFHLGTLSLNGRALHKAVDWASQRDLDLVAVTGDLVSRRRGVRTLTAELGRLRPRHGTYAVLGNHDVASTRDPFSRPADLSGVATATLLDHESVILDIRGATPSRTGRWLDPRPTCVSSSSTFPTQ